MSQHSAPLPYSTMKAKTTGWAYVAQGPKEKKEYVQQGPCTTTTTTMIIARGRMRIRRRQEDHETTKTGVATTMVCHRMCDYRRYSPKEEERRTIVTTTGVQAQGEGCRYDTTTRMTAMVTTMQDRLQEEVSVKRTTTSLDYVIRLTDRLQSLRTKCMRFILQSLPFKKAKRWAENEASAIYIYIYIYNKNKIQ